MKHLRHFSYVTIYTIYYVNSRIPGYSHANKLQSLCSAYLGKIMDGQGWGVQITCYLHGLAAGHTPRDVTITAIPDNVMFPTCSYAVSRRTSISFFIPASIVFLGLIVVFD